MKSPPYTLDQRVIASVEKRLPYGVFVRLADGTRAYIRRREMSWAGDIDPQELVKEQQEIEAVVIALGDGTQEIELSHKKTLPDPWPVFMQRFRPGDVVEGTVKDLKPYGVHVEILPGVNGLIPLNELALWDIEKPEDVVWVGDNVEAVIARIHAGERKIWLSMRRRLAQLSTLNSFMEYFTPAPAAAKTPCAPPTTKETAASPGQEKEAGTLAKGQVGRVLVVEGQADLHASLVKWFCEQGYQTEGADSAAEALQKVQNQSISVCFVALGLPDRDGLAFVRQLKNEGHQVQTVIMSMPGELAERFEEMAQLGDTAVLLKPLDLNEINSLLATIAGGQSLPAKWKPSAATRQRKPGAFQKLAHVMGSNIPLAQRLQLALEKLLELTQATQGIVFYANPESQNISIVAQAGAGSINQEAIYSLHESPVKDVVQEEEPVLEYYLSGRVKRRFRRLQELLPFESCIGVPVSAGGKTHHALFLFHRKRRAFNRYRLRDAQAIAMLLSVALESEALQKQIQTVSVMLLNGQLATGFGHEVYNKITALELQLHNLQSSYESMQKQLLQREVVTLPAEIEQAQETLLKTTIELKKTAELFQSLMRAEEIWQIDVNQVIQQTKMQLRPILGKSRTKVKLNLAEKLPAVTGSPIRLRQVFLNIVLNAVQHMARHPQGKREICIDVTYEKNSNKRPVKVRIADTGPGIHKQLWQKVFRLGFSTRPDGTGVGLFMARGLVENMGGHICVEKSTILLGTTFLVELPAAAEED